MRIGAAAGAGLTGSAKTGASSDEERGRGQKPLMRGSVRALLFEFV